MVMRWSGMEGQVTKGPYYATVELITENGEPLWFCLFSKDTGDWAIREFFEVGKLEQAYEWCVNQLKGDEQESKERGNLESQTV